MGWAWLNRCWLWEIVLLNKSCVWMCVLVSVRAGWQDADNGGGQRESHVSVWLTATDKRRRVVDREFTVGVETAWGRGAAAPGMMCCEHAKYMVTSQCDRRPTWLYTHTRRHENHCLVHINRVDCSCLSHADMQTISCSVTLSLTSPFSASTLLVGWQEGHRACQTLGGVLVC